MPAEQLEQYLARVVLTPHTARTVSSVEKLRLALRNVRRHGYALVDQEYEVGLRSIAVPVHSPTGRVVATVNLSGSAPRISLYEMQTRLFAASAQRSDGAGRIPALAVFERLPFRVLSIAS